jgi:cytochrome c
MTLERPASTFRTSTGPRANRLHRYEKSDMRAGERLPWVNRIGLLLGLLLCTAGPTWPAVALAADEVAARDLAQSSGCFKCHGVDKKKDGPAFRDSAAKYKDDPDAQNKLIYHVTSGEKVKFDDGHEEAHKKVKTQNPAETRNLVQWILSLPGGTKP